MMILRAAVIFSEGLFEGETLAIHPPSADVSTSIDVALLPPKDIPFEMLIRVMKHFLLYLCG